MTILRYATEYEDGLRQYVCDKCGYTFTNAIPATGHKWSDWTVVVEPTPTSEGLKYRVCTRYPDNPHYEYASIPMLDSSESSQEPASAQTNEPITEASVPVSASVVPDDAGRFISFVPNALDGALVITDAGVTLVWLLLVLPLIPPLLWIRKKKAEAKEEYKDQKEREKPHAQRGRRI